MSEFNIGDIVLVNENAQLEGRNELFTYVMSRVLEVKESELVLGLHTLRLTVPDEYCEKQSSDNIKHRVELFEDTLTDFLQYFGAKIYAETRNIYVTFDEGDTFHPIKINYNEFND